MQLAEYIDALDQLCGDRTRPDCSLWALAHSSVSSQGFHQILRADPPMLLSRAARGNARGDHNDDFVFAYAAPRFKPPPLPPVVLIFSALGSDAGELAHPFDSGGLRKHPRIEVANRRLVAGLVFEAPWRPMLSLYVAALFDDPRSYLRGVPPDRQDPLSLANRIAHDALFFTWEIKTPDRLPFHQRLVGAVVTRDADYRIRINETSYHLLVRKAQTREIRLEEVDDSIDALNQALLDCYENPSRVVGWS